MQSWVDGKPSQSLPLDDRGFQYGDGLFETIRVFKGKAPLLVFHLDRLQTGAKALGISFEPLQLKHYLDTVLENCDQDHHVLKLLVTRGSSLSGYSSTSNEARIICQLRACKQPPDRPESLNCSVSSVTLSRQPLLAGIKHLNRLENVLAANQLASGVDQALLLDIDGYVIETQHSNLFWLRDGKMFTPSLDYSGVAGVARRIVIEKLLPQNGITVQTGLYKIDDVLQADEVFCTNSVRGIQSISSIDADVFNNNEFTSLLFVKWWDYFYEAAENAA